MHTIAADRAYSLPLRPPARWLSIVAVLLLHLILFAAWFYWQGSEKTTLPSEKFIQLIYLPPSITLPAAPTQSRPSSQPAHTSAPQSIRPSTSRQNSEGGGSLSNAIHIATSDFLDPGAENRALHPLPADDAKLDARIANNLRKPEALLETPLAKAINQAERPDCRTAYQGGGLLALPALLRDSLRDKGCKW